MDGGSCIKDEHKNGFVTMNVAVTSVKRATVLESEATNGGFVHEEAPEKDGKFSTLDTDSFDSFSLSSESVYDNEECVEDLYEKTENGETNEGFVHSIPSNEGGVANMQLDGGHHDYAKDQFYDPVYIGDSNNTADERYHYDPNYTAYGVKEQNAVSGSAKDLESSSSPSQENRGNVMELTRSFENLGPPPNPSLKENFNGLSPKKNGETNEGFVQKEASEEDGKFFGLDTDSFDSFSDSSESVYDNEECVEDLDERTENREKTQVLVHDVLTNEENGETNEGFVHDDASEKEHYEVATGQFYDLGHVVNQGTVAREYRSNPMYIANGVKDQNGDREYSTLYADSFNSLGDSSESVYDNEEHIEDSHDGKSEKPRTKKSGDAEKTAKRDGVTGRNILHSTKNRFESLKNRIIPKEGNTSCGDGMRKFLSRLTPRCRWKGSGSCGDSIRKRFRDLTSRFRKY